MCLSMDESLGFLINDTARLFRRSLNARMRSTGVTGLQFRLMGYLMRYQGINQRALAELIEVEPITLSRMVDRLAEAGQVERRPNPEDRRAWQLYLTDKATPTISHLKGEANDLIDDAVAGLSEKDRQELARMMKHIRGNLSRRESAHG